jgi:hypothetical protein
VTQYTFTEEPRGERYRTLIAYAPRLCSEAQLVIRDGIGLSSDAGAIIESLKPWLLEQRQTSEWSGTKLHNRTAALFRYELCPDTLLLLSHSVGGLYEWVQPQRPEDLALLLPDGTPWLTSIAHERDAYLTMTTDQAAVLFSECVDLSRLLGNPTSPPTVG